MAIEDLKLQKRIAERELSIEIFLNDLQRIYSGSLRDVITRLDRESPSAIDAASVINDIESVLAANGFGAVYRSQMDIYRDELLYINESLAGAGVAGAAATIAGADIPLMQTLAIFENAKIAKTFEVLLGDVKAYLYRSYILGEQIDLSSTVESYGDAVFANLKTEFNTTMATFSRTVTAKKAEDAGLELFLYIGPSDDKTRPFCAARLSRSPAIYTKAEISEMDNGQTGDVLSTGGGYNCRHQWSPLSLKAAKEMGYDG